MDEDPEARLRPSTSALLALDGLAMPSPIQDSFSLLSSSISGEIPILLSPELADVLHKNNLNISGGDSCTYSPPSEEIWLSRRLDSSLTFNTFGVATETTRDLTSSSGPGGEASVETVPSHTIRSTTISTSRRDFSESLDHLHQQSQREQPSCPEPSEICNSTPHALGKSNSCNSWVTFEFEEYTSAEARTGTGSPFTDDELDSTYDQLVPLESSPPSLRYRCASASGLVGSSAAIRLGEAASPCMEPSSSQCARIFAILQSCRSPSSRRKSAVAAALATLEARSNSAPSSPIRPSHLVTQESPRASLSSSLPPHVPTHLSRLLNSAVELLIDQEGFRTVLARFQVHAIQDPDLTPPHRKEMAGMVLFRPVRRQKFPFHYGPIDRPPVLRRLTVEGEPGRDYLCRQASLCLKSNGVYLVRGTENSALVAAASDKREDAQGSETKLHWRFEYLVNDRPVRSSGRILDGEKLLTPISFACSPLLLHPIQGRRIGLVHVIRKALVPNVAARAFLPPTGLLASPSPSDRTPTPPILASSDYSSHRRAQSFCSAELDQNQGSVAPRNHHPPNRPLKEVPSSRRAARHRRASSAGEEDHPKSLRQEARVRSQESLGRFIIPPNQLPSLIECGGAKDNVKASPTPRAAELGITLQPRPLSYMPLSPRPRFPQQHRK